MNLSNAKLFINPAAGRWKGEKLTPKIIAYLRRCGLQSEATLSRNKGDLIPLVKAAIFEGYQTIIIAGGDGSINEAVNGIMQASSIVNDNHINIGIIPLGTGNDFIKATNIPKNWRKTQI